MGVEAARATTAEEFCKAAEGRAVAQGPVPDRGGALTATSGAHAMKTSIRKLLARQILDSRGRPTVEVDAWLEGGAFGRASVPSGASTGAAEAHELRDGDPAHYAGLGVLKAVANVNGEIAQALGGNDALDQRRVDDMLLALDGTPQLARLGANAILGVSLAVCRAAAQASEQQLYQRIAQLCGVTAPTLPLPMTNILSGGLHAGRGMDVQDFLAVPLRAATIAEAIHLLARVRNAATEVARQTRPAHAAGRRRGPEPRPRIGPGRAANDGRGDRARGAEAGRGHRHRDRRRGQHAAGRRRSLSLCPRGRAAKRRRDDRDAGVLGRRISGGVDRGRPGRGRLERLGRPHPRAGRARATGRRRPVRHQRRPPAARHRPTASPTACWSRPTRTAP